MSVSPVPEPAAPNEDRVSIGRSMPAAPASLQGWAGLPEKVDVLGVLTPALIHETSPRATDRTTRTWRD